MPSGQTLYLMMFVGKYSCTSHVLQYSSSLSYEHSRSLQSFLCSGAVIVLICSFFVAASLNLHNFKNGGKITHFFTIYQTFLHLFLHIQKNWYRFLLFFHYFFVPLHPKSAIKREQSDGCINFVEREQTRQSQASRAVPERVTRQPSFSLATVVSMMRKISFTSKTKVMQNHIYYK